MAITIREVARQAGVSTATVSRALRGLSNVDEKTRARVEAVAKDLDYVISPSASRLASGRTGSIAVVTPHIAQWFFSTILTGVESVLQEAGVDVLLISVDTSEGTSPKLVAPKLRRRVDGVLVLVLPPDDENFRAIRDLGMPMSVIGVNQSDITSVTIDDVLAARIGTQHLIDLGHRHIGLIGGDPGQGPFTAEHDRLSGFRAALAEANIEFNPELEVHGHFTIDGGELAMSALLALPQRPTAVLCMSDEMAYGAMRALRNHGLQPGLDISLVGIDGHDMSEYLDLTTVVQPVADLGRIAAESLLEQIQLGPDLHEAQDIRVPTQLIIRGSSAPVHARS
jgi:LacI family repressor for deo operon, udp, cdd, tsx, nupC, and nupG